MMDGAPAAMWDPEAKYKDRHLFLFPMHAFLLTVSLGLEFLSHGLALTTAFVGFITFFFKVFVPVCNLIHPVGKVCLLLSLTQHFLSFSFQHLLDISCG